MQNVRALVASCRSLTSPLIHARLEEHGRTHRRRSRWIEREDGSLSERFGTIEMDLSAHTTYLTVTQDQILDWLDARFTIEEYNRAQYLTGDHDDIMQHPQVHFRRGPSNFRP